MSDLDVDRMAGKLARLPAQRRALRAAMREFGDDFELRAWTQGFESSEPVHINRVLAVTGGYSALVNNTLEAVRLGASAAGITPPRGTRGASLRHLPGFVKSFAAWLEARGVAVN